MKRTQTKLRAEPLYGCQVDYERRPYGARQHRLTYTWASIVAETASERWSLGDPYPAIHWPNDLLAYEIAAQLCARNHCPGCGAPLECRMATDQSDWILRCTTESCARWRLESPAIPIHPRRNSDDGYRAAFPDVQAWLRVDTVAGVVYVDKVLLLRDRRGQGQGRGWLQTLCDAARTRGQSVVLTAPRVFQAEPAAALRGWLGRMGFVSHRDPTLPGALIKLSQGDNGKTNEAAG